MKKLLLIAVVTVFALSSCNVGGGGSLKNDEDSVAYYLGLDLGRQMRMSDSTMKVNLVTKGISDAFNKKAKVHEDSVGKWLQEYYMVRLPAKNKKESEDFLAGIEKNKNVQKTESGLLYEVIMPGNDQKPLSDLDEVKVNYIGTFKDGREFDSSKDTATMKLTNVIPGWREGLKLIGEGGKIKLWIPSDLAYGPYGRGNIKPNEALVFEIDLFEVDHAPAPEEK